MRQYPPQPAERFPPVSDKKTQVPQGLRSDLLDSSVLPQNPPHTDLEARVRDIADKEGVTLPRTNRPVFTSITLTTRRRSPSPSPTTSTSPAPPLSPAPEPLHLTELSTGAAEPPEANGQLPPTQQEDKKTREPALALEPNQTLYTRNQKRLGRVGGQLDECTPPSEHLLKEDASVHDGFNPDVRGAEPHAGTGYISHVHLTLSPKATGHSLTDAADVTGTSQKDFAPPIRSSSAPSSPDEGVGLSSPPEWLDAREPRSQGGRERTRTSNQFKAIASTSAQSFTQRHRPEVSTTKSPGSD